MKKKNESVILREIPQRIFAEFSAPDGPKDCEIFQCGKTTYTVCISKTKRVGPNGPLILVLRNKSCTKCKRFVSEIVVFNRPVEYHFFSAKYTGTLPKPLLTLRFLCRKSVSFCNSLQNKPEKGKGLWIEEEIQVVYGDCSGHSIILSSGCSSWEFEFILEIQAFALSLTEGRLVLGHWEREWEPHWQ